MAKGFGNYRENVPVQLPVEKVDDMFDVAMRDVKEFVNDRRFGVAIFEFREHIPIDDDLRVVVMRRRLRFGEDFEIVVGMRGGELDS